MSKKFLGSVIPFSGILTKLFGKETVEEVREDFNDNFRIEGKGLVPGAVEIPLEKMIEAGFNIRFFLKDATDAPVDTFDSGIIICSIQHDRQKECRVIDGGSFKFDPKSEIEISTLSSAIVNGTVPEAFGPNYDIEKLLDASSERIEGINTEIKNNKEVRDKKIKFYEENPEQARKHTKKALDNMKYQHEQLVKKNNKTEHDVAKFQENMVRLIGEVYGMNQAKTFEDLKKIPELKAEFDKSNTLEELFENFSKAMEAKQEAEEKVLKNLSEDK